MKSTLHCILQIGIMILLCTARSTFAEGASKDTVALRGEFFCALERSLALPYSGVITELRAKVGQSVKRGDVLLRFEPDPYAKAELNKAASPAALSGAEAQLAIVEDKATVAKTAASEAEQMAEKNLVSKQQLDQTLRLAKVAEASVEAARARAAFERKQFEDNAQRLAELTDGGDGSLVIKAPIDGVVIWIYGGAREGATIQARVPIIMLGVMDTMILRAHVHELEAVKLEISDDAEIHPLALPDLSLSGTLSRIAWAPVPHNLPEPSYFELEIVVPNPDHTIHQGYKADIIFNKTK